jgi:hypothetical protein
MFWKLSNYIYIYIGKIYSYVYVPKIQNIPKLPTHKPEIHPKNSSFHSSNVHAPLLP